MNYDTAGLSLEAIEKIIDNELDKNADVMMGVDDPEMQEMIQVLKYAFVKALL